MSSKFLSALAVLAMATAWGCGGDDGGGDSGTGGGGTGGAAGSGTGGAAGSTAGTGGTSTGGAAGSSTGGAAGSGTGGAAGSGTGGAAGSGTGGAAGSAAFWDGAYDANGSPSPAGGKHNPGKDCLNCHKSNGSAPAWVFGGTVYKADKTTPAPHVQVGVRDGANLYTAYTATNGNFWLAAGPTINWASADIRVRNANGESAMTSAANGGSCNTCHTGTAVIVEP